MFDFFKRRHRSRLTAEPFPSHWLGYLRRNVSHFAVLTDSERTQLLDDLRIFRDEKVWEGAGGLVLTDEIIVTISAQACLLTLCLPERDDYFRGVSTIIVYPAGYRVKENRPSGPLGIIDERASWRSARHGGMVPWYCPGPMHEGRARGKRAARMSSCTNSPTNSIWKTVRRKEPPVCTPVSSMRSGIGLCHNPNDRLKARLWWRYRGMEGDLVLNSYGATDAAEFFAVATEAFFERPRALHRHWPDLYAVLRGYYLQDPAARVLRHLRKQPRRARSLWLGN